MGISPYFNDKEFFELIWMYERMAEQREKENQANNKNRDGNSSIGDMIGGRRSG